jgi:murein DD-endopeptidase MepM/ murein hydrolase activator NlpD
LAGGLLKRIVGFTDRVFREREIILRSDTGVRYVVLTPTVQQVMAGGLTLAVLCLIWALIARQEAWRLVEFKQSEVARVEEAYRMAIDSLGAAVDTAQEKGRAESAVQLLNLVEQNESLEQRLGDIRSRLATAEAERARAAAAHEGLIARLRKLDDQVRSMVSRHHELSSLTTTLSDGLDEAMAERGRLAVESDRLASDRTAVNTEIAELGKRQAALNASHEATIAQIAERTKAGIDGLKRLINRTGLDADKVLHTQSPGVGGPFVPASKREDASRANLVGLGSQIGHLQEMRKLLRSLPVGAPADAYTVMSPFGVRRDPFTGQPAMHNGLDLAAANHSPVAATAPGTVTVAGWSGEFGNMIEISHGFGLSTRYAHLSRVHVKVGQHVAARQVIGLVGTTGRSTGPHVHYEVLSEGKNLNPAKFLEAARYVPKNQ